MKTKLMRRLLLLSLVIVVAIGSFYIGTRFKHTNNQNQILPEKYSQVYSLLEEEWLNYDEIENTDDNLIKGMVAALGDPYTEYLTSTEATEFSESLSDDYYGIGILTDENCKIELIQDNSPAMSAGLQIGDIIQKVNKEEPEDYEELQDMIRSNQEEQLDLTISRNGKNKNFTIISEKMNGDVLYSTTTLNDKTYGYLSIRFFGSETSSRVEDALEYFNQNNVNRIILDLRDDLGGYVEGAINTLDLFFEPNTLICSLVDKKGNTTEYKTKSDHQYQFSEGIIYVNEYTASAAEILAGCLQQQLDYKLVGTNTYGKGIAQTYHTFSDLSVLKYTYAYWQLADGTSIQGTGLKVDQEEEMESLRYIAIA